MILLGFFVVTGSALAIWGSVVSKKIHNDNTKRNLANPFFYAGWCAMVAASVAGVAFLMILDGSACDWFCCIGLAGFFIYSFVGIALAWREFKKGA